MIPIWKVSKGVKVRLINLETKTERNHTLKEDLEICRADVVFTPTKVYEDSKHEEIVTEYGFKFGEGEKREKTIAVVQATDVEHMDEGE